MNSGIVRKVDELGRVVIPKEMRRTLGINTGSSIEMSVGEGGEVVLKKFSDISNIMPLIEKLAQTIFDEFGVPILVSDQQQILAGCGTKKDILGREVIVKQCKNPRSPLPSDRIYKTFEGDKIYQNCYIFDIKNDGFECGYLISLSDKSIEALPAIKCLATFLSKVVSE